MSKKGTRDYSILVPAPTLERAQACLDALRTGRLQAGRLLAEQAGSRHFMEADALGLLARLFDTRQAQIFAESAVAGDGSDWNLVELGLLGDISVVVPVTVFDNGAHQHPVVHDAPFAATLLFTPGALLRNDRGGPAADWNEVVTSDGGLTERGYFELYQRRLLPVFRYINRQATASRPALVTVPGLGCGQFAGPFEGQLGSRLESVLERLLREHRHELANIRAVYFDPFAECRNARQRIGHIDFMTRPLLQAGNQDKPQLCRPQAYAETGDDFDACELYSIVAWDHVSWPGNDFYGGSRSTDDGVKAAATSAMAAITGVSGRYDPAQAKYLPPNGYRDWNELVRQHRADDGLRLWDPEVVVSDVQSHSVRRDHDSMTR